METDVLFLVLDSHTREEILMFLNSDPLNPEIKYHKLQGKYFSFIQTTYKFYLFLDLDPNPNLLHCLIKNTGMFQFLCLTYIDVFYFTHRDTSETKQIMP